MLYIYNMRSHDIRIATVIYKKGHISTTDSHAFFMNKLASLGATLVRNSADLLTH